MRLGTYTISQTLLNTSLYKLYGTNCYIICVKECPTGIVNEEAFKEIFAQFFPQGSMFFWFCNLPKLQTFTPE